MVTPLQDIFFGYEGILDEAKEGFLLRQEGRDGEGDCGVDRHHDIHGLECFGVEFEEIHEISDVVHGILETIRLQDAARFSAQVALTVGDIGSVGDVVGAIFRLGSALQCDNIELISVDVIEVDGDLGIETSW